MDPFTWSDGSLRSRGFHPEEGGWSYRRSDLKLLVSDGWLTLEKGPSDPAADPLRELAGRPGLWKRVTAGRDLHFFELPTFPFEKQSSDWPIEMVDWALATVSGTGLEGWNPPPLEELEPLLGTAGLTVQAGGILLQGAVIRRPGRLALACPLLPPASREIPAARKEWLRSLLIDAQNRWRMVRCGWDDGGGSAGYAEVDLSGAPAPFLDVLLPAALEALRWVVAWLAHSVAFLADGTIPCRALEVCPTRG